MRNNDLPTCGRFNPRLAHRVRFIFVVIVTSLENKHRETNMAAINLTILLGTILVVCLSLAISAEAQSNSTASF